MAMRPLAQLLVSALPVLAMLCVAAGPSASASCVSTCACDDDGERADAELVHDEHADDECADEHGAEHGDHEDECPDDCPGCACGGGASAAPTLVAVFGGPAGVTTASVRSLVEARGSGVSSAVFRPPRA